MPKKKEQKSFYLRQDDEDRLDRCGNHYGLVLSDGKVNRSGTVKLALERLDELREAEASGGRVLRAAAADEDKLREAITSAMVLSEGDRDRARALLRVSSEEWIRTIGRVPGLAASLAERWPS